MIYLSPLSLRYLKPPQDWNSYPAPPFQAEKLFSIHISSGSLSLIYSSNISSGSLSIYSSKMVSMKIQSQPARSFWISWGLWFTNIKDSGAVKTNSIIK